MSQDHDTVDRLLKMLGSELPLGTQQAIIKVWKERSAHAWATEMPLCIPETDNALPEGWLEWALRVLPVLLEQVTVGVPEARVRSVTVPTTWMLPTYQFEAPQIGFSLEVQEDPVTLPGLAVRLAMAGWTRELDIDCFVRYTFGPGKVVGVDIGMNPNAWSRLRAAQRAAAAVPPPPVVPSDEPPPVANNGGDSEIPF